jgi:ABC-type lipoprotein release transport system permease subunit
VIYRFRRELRTGWLSWFALAVLIGVVVGTVFTLAAGARRTGSAQDRYFRASNAYDIGIRTQCGKVATGRAEQHWSDECHGQLARLPSVAEAATVNLADAYVTTADRQSLAPEPEDRCYSGPGEVQLMDGGTDFGRTLNRRHFVAGREVRPDAVDEVVISQATAERVGVRVGDPLLVYHWSKIECGHGMPFPVRVRVVGIQLSPGEFRGPSGTFLQFLEVTPAFVRATRLNTDPYLAVRLRPDATVADFTEQAEKAGYDADIAADRIANGELMQEAIRPSELSLGLLAAVLAIGAVAVLGQLLYRSSTIEAQETGILGALGMRRSDFVMQDALRGVVLALIAATVAIVVAIVASPSMPIGIARELEPHRGAAVDAWVLGFGVAALIVFVVAVTCLAGIRARSVRGPRPVPKTLPNAVRRSDLPPSVLTGTNLALTRGSGTSAVPVLSSMVSLALAVALIVAALTFAEGVAHLRATPRLVGWNWSALVYLPDVERTPAEGARLREQIDKELAATPEVTAASPSILFSPFPDSAVLELGRAHLDVAGIVAFDGRSEVGPSIIDGRKPRAADEIALGPDTLRNLALNIGDAVDAYGHEGTIDRDEPGAATHTRMKIVGTAVVPQAGRLGEGAAMTLDGLARLNPRFQEQVYVVRTTSERATAHVVERIRRLFPFDLAAEVGAFDIGVSDPLLRLEAIDAIPTLLTLATIALAAIVLAHVFFSIVRARRRDVAILRVLGFSRVQTLRTIGCQACTYALVAVVIGVPIGLFAGRLAWLAYARDLGVIPESATPWTSLAFTVVIAVVLTLVVAIPEAWRAVRTRPAVVLHSE